MSTKPSVADTRAERFLLVTAVVAVGLFVMYFVLGHWFPDSAILGYGFEDGLVEYLGAAFWAAASAICAFRLIKGQEPRLLLVM